MFLKILFGNEQENTTSNRYQNLFPNLESQTIFSGQPLAVTNKGWRWLRSSLKMLLLCRTYVPYFSLHVDLVGEIWTWRKVFLHMQSPNLFNQNIFVDKNYDQGDGSTKKRRFRFHWMRWRILNFFGKEKNRATVGEMVFFLELKLLAKSQSNITS